MSTPAAQPGQPPRMWLWLVATVLLAIAAHNAQARYPGLLIAVSLYKAHLMSLGGWGGYWLDRALYPYARPHSYLEDEEVVPPDLQPGEDFVLGQLLNTHDYPLAMLRRAVIVAACLVCVGLGA